MLIHVMFSHQIVDKTAIYQRTRSSHPFLYTQISTQTLFGCLPEISSNQDKQTSTIPRISNNHYSQKLKRKQNSTIITNRSKKVKMAIASQKKISATLLTVLAITLHGTSSTLKSNNLDIYIYNLVSKSITEIDFECQIVKF